MKIRKRKNKGSAPGLSFSAMLLLAVMGLYSCTSGESEGTGAEAYTQDQAAAGAEAAAPEPAAATDEGKGVGPVTDAHVGADIDAALAGTGKGLFEAKCSACHQLTDQKVVGPGLSGVTERRKPEWIMNMILNPEGMTKQDPTAKKLLGEHLTQMTNQNVNEQDARAILEYFRQNDKAI